MTSYHAGTERHWDKMREIQRRYKLGKFAKGDGRFTGKEIKCVGDTIVVSQPLYVAEKVHPIPVDRKRKQQKMSYCTEAEITALRALLGSLSWLAKESRPDLAGKVALLQQSMPRPYVQDLIDANAVAKEAKDFPEIGIVINPISPEHLRVGTVTDASWGNARSGDLEACTEDFWEELPDRWVRHHRMNRRIKFHPGATSDGPDLHLISRDRTTITNKTKEVQDSWDQKTSLEELDGTTWTGRTEFFKGDVDIRKVAEKFLQRAKVSSQAGFLVFFYDRRMETDEGDFPISLVHWRSFKLKRNTVNTLSAECQAMIAGVGGIHWQRLILQESRGKCFNKEPWEKTLSEVPFVAVTDSKSLYDTIAKVSNTSSHIEDKRTAIDVTILRDDLRRTQGQVRWISGEYMLADSLTKRMNAQALRNVMSYGRWSLCKRGCQNLRNQQILFLGFESHVKT